MTTHYSTHVICWAGDQRISAWMNMYTLSSQWIAAHITTEAHMLHMTHVFSSAVIS